MKADLWKKIDELFAAAQAQPAGQRAAFLDRACEGDQELRAELESLLKAATADKSFLEHPPAAPSDRPALKAGDKLGAFEIVERIGRGGMGEVYRARDSRLKRDVAIKVLPPDFADDPRRLRRFEHEARAVSALKHPNIVSVYDIGSTDGVSWMVTELVEGRSLREVLAKGAMPPRKAAEIGAQIADGLAAAHAAGLVHRDLKAENVMLAPGDLVKILDFGIAKRAVPEAGASTVTDTLTRTGEVVGTVTSMSPEQVEGKEVDHRSDIFSLGVLLYEMLSGRRPFTGETHAAVMNAIVSQELPDLPQVVPDAITTITHRCVAKLPERRFQSAADLAFALRSAVPAQLRVESQRKGKMWPMLAAAAVVLLLTGSGLYWLGRSSAPPVPTFHGAMRRLTWDDGLTTDAVISPDGRLVAYASDRDSGSNLDIYVQQIGGGGTVRLTEGPADHNSPAFTADGSRVAFVLSGEGAGIYEAPALGGDARLLVPSGSRPGFSPDGRFLVYLAGGIGGRRFPGGAQVYVQPMAGGEATLLSRGCSNMDPVTAVWSPDSERILFWGTCAGRVGWWVADRDGRSLQPTRYKGYQNGWRSGQWLAHPPRLLRFVVNGDNSDLAANQISADGREITGPAQLLTSGMGAIESASASLEGRIVCSTRELSSTLWRLTVDPQGRAKGDPVQIPTGWSGCMAPALSRDGRSLAFIATHALSEEVASIGTSESELRIMDLATGAVTQVVRKSGLAGPVLDVDGNKLLFHIERLGDKLGDNPVRLMEVNSHGGAEREIMPLRDWSGPWVIPRDWRADGSFYLVDFWPLPTRYGIAALHPQDLKPIPILTDPEHDLHNGTFSHDRRWITFNAAANGHSRIYAAPFRMGTVPQSEWIPLTDGAIWDDKPRLAGDDRILFFLSDRDGYRCIWRQRLRPDIHPEGAPEAVFHFHSSKHWFLAMDLNSVEMAAGPGVLIFNLGNARGNIWMLDPGSQGDAR